MHRRDIHVLDLWLGKCFFSHLLWCESERDSPRIQDQDAFHVHALAPAGGDLPRAAVDDQEEGPAAG